MAGAGPEAVSQEASAGRIRVATWPGGVMAAATASAAAGATSSGPMGRLIQPDTLLARASMSDSSGASYCLWKVAWSPTMLTMRGGAPAGVVQVGDAVAQPGPEVQQGGRRPLGHTGVAVGGPGHRALEQSEDGPHLGHVVERGDEVHLRRARVGEAHVDPTVDEGADECLGAVGGHDECSSVLKTVPGLRIPLGSNAALMRRMRAILAGSSRSRK